MDGSLAVAVNQDEVESFLHIPYSVFAFSLFGLLLKNTLDLHIPYLILWYLYERAKEGSLSLRSLEYRLAVSDERKNMKKKEILERESEISPRSLAWDQGDSLVASTMIRLQGYECFDDEVSHPAATESVFSPPARHQKKSIETVVANKEEWKWQKWNEKSPGEAQERTWEDSLIKRIFIWRHAGGL